MSPVWDHTLWDTYNPQLYSFTKYNQDFLKQYTDFLDRRAKIEEKYARELRKLCKECKSKDYDKREKIKFSLQFSFDDMLTELTALANQHDTMREDLLKSSKELKDTLKELLKQSQLTEKRVQGLSLDLEKSRKQLEGVRQQYTKSFAELRKAKEDYATSKDNKDITKNEEERFHNIFLQRETAFEDKKHSYAKELTDFNNAQRKYYMELLPEQLASLQEHEQKLVAACRLHFQTWGDSELQSLSMQTKCAQALRGKADLPNADADIQEFLRVTASGHPVPQDLQFDDLGSSDNLGGLQQPALMHSKRGTKSSGTLKSGCRIMSNVGPAQQKRLLEEALRNKDIELDKANKELDGLQKLLATYQQNPKIGDVGMVQQQMQPVTERLAKLNEERAAIVVQWSEAAVEDLRRHERRGGNTSCCLSFFSIAAAPPRPSKAAATDLQGLQVEVGGSSASVSGPYPGASITSSVVPQQASPVQQHQSAFADEFDDTPSPGSAASAAPSAQTPPPPRPPQPAAAAPALPMVEMVYDFNDPSQPDNLAVRANERLHVLQRDIDWTLVKRIHGNEQGYVPTAYMKDV